MSPQEQDTPPVGPMTRGQLKRVITETLLATLGGLSSAEERATRAEAELQPIRRDMFLWRGRAAQAEDRLRALKEHAPSPGVSAEQLANRLQAVEAWRAGAPWAYAEEAEIEALVLEVAAWRAWAARGEGGSDLQANLA